MPCCGGPLISLEIAIIYQLPKQIMGATPTHSLENAVVSPSTKPIVCGFWVTSVYRSGSNDIHGIVDVGLQRWYQRRRHGTGFCFGAVSIGFSRKAYQIAQSCRLKHLCIAQSCASMCRNIALMYRYSLI